MNLSQFALKLEENTPKSELWFYGLYTKYPNDLYNNAFGPYIPDVINHNQMYVIEIDGSIHDLPEIQAKDAVKTKFYQSKGYNVYRIKAYDVDSFNACMRKLERT